MNHQTQNALTIFLSTLLLGAAGYWLIPNQAKGAIVGGIIGAVVAASHRQQENRIRQLTHQQRQLLASQHDSGRTYQESFNTLSNWVTQVSEGVDDMAISIAEHDQKINHLENAVASHQGKAQLAQLSPGQPPPNRQTINPMPPINLEDLKVELNPQAADADRLSQHSWPGPEVLVEAEPENLSEEAIAQAIIDWFSHQGIAIESYYQPDPIIDGYLDDLALYLGNHYAVLRDFYQRLKSSIGRRSRFNLHGYTATECSIHHEFLSKLRASAILAFGRYFKERPDFIIAEPFNRKDIQRFLDGGWFERFIYYKTAELLDFGGIDYQYLRNPMIAYPGENGAEIDLFFLIDNIPLLIECKSGQNYDEGIERFVWHREKLGLEPGNAIFSVLDLDEPGALLRARQWQIAVVNQNGFSSYIKGIFQIEDEDDEQLRLDIKDKLQEENPDEVAAAEDVPVSLASFFRSQKLNLEPAYRVVVFEELIRLFDQNYVPVTFNMVTKIIRDRISEKDITLARHKVHEILISLLHSNYFRGQYNKSERNASRPITRLHSKDLATLEQASMEYYARQILNRFDPDFFEIEENIQEFEALTLGKAPTPDVVQQIKLRQPAV